MVFDDQQDLPGSLTDSEDGRSGRLSVVPVVLESELAINGYALTKRTIDESLRLDPPPTFIVRKRPHYFLRIVQNYSAPTALKT